MEGKFSITGKTPLLTHSTRIMVVQAKKAKGKGKWIPSAEEEAELSTYIPDDQIGYGLPSIALRGAIVKAGGAWPVPGQRMQKMGSRLGHILIGPEAILPLLSIKGERLEKYAIDVQRAVVQRQGISRSRARFDKWRVDFVIEFDEELVPGGEDYIREILADAGNRIGVGDYRPEKKGPYGRFNIS